MSDTSIRMSLPTSAGSTCWYSIGSTLTAEACSPALCANAENPTYGWGVFGGRLARVGATQRHGLGARLGRDPHHLQGVGGVGAVPVEEMLGVEEHPLALGGQVPHRVGDHGEVLGQGGPQRRGDVPVVA